MPKETFLNLPQEKRDRFTEAALDEFALHDYRRASVSRIVDAVGIAKGSFYQYFDDKKDLYRYLVTIAAKTKFAYIDRSVGAEGRGFFERFKMSVFHGARFDVSQPRYASILYNATYEQSGSETLDVSAALRDSALEYIRGLVEDGLRSKDLRGGIDVDFAVFALYQLSVSLKDFLADRLGFSLREAVQKGSPSSIRDDELLAVLEELVQLFRRGLAQAPKVPGT